MLATARCAVMSKSGPLSSPKPDRLWAETLSICPIPTEDSRLYQSRSVLARKILAHVQNLCGCKPDPVRPELTLSLSKGKRGSRRVRSAPCTNFRHEPDFFIRVM